MIQKMHQRDYHEPRDAARLRTCNVSVGDHIPVDYRLVPLKMNELIEWFKKEEHKLGVIQLVAEMHYRLVYLHPFRNGNGRCARLLGNFILARKGFNPIILRERTRPAYYAAINKANKTGGPGHGNLTRSYNFFARYILNAEIK